MRQIRPLLCFGMACISGFVNGQSDSILKQSFRDTTYLDILTVSASGTNRHQRLHDLPPGTFTLNHSDIRQVNATDLPALLKISTMADIRQRGAFDVQADVSVQGGSFEQSLILLNGIPFNDPQTGHHSLNLPFSAEDISSIVITGSSQPGMPSGNAISGVVDVSVKNNRELRRSLESSMTAGAFGLRRGRMALFFPTGQWGHYISVDEAFANGHTNNTDFNRRHLWLSSTRDFSIGNLNISGGWMSKAFGANSFYSARYPEQFEEVSAMVFMGRLSGGKMIQWNGFITFREHHDRFELFRNEAPEWYAGHNYHRTIVSLAGLHAVRHWKNGTTSASIHTRYERILSSVLGQPTDPVPVKGVEAWYRYGDHRNYTEGLITHSLSVKNSVVKLQTATVIMPDGKIMLLPGGRIHYSPTSMPGLEMAGAVKRNYRMPTFTELYYQGPMNTGNPNLNAEESVAAEFSAGYHYKALRSEASVFFRDNKNLIDWIRMEDQIKWKSENLTGIYTTGITLHFTYTPERMFAGIRKLSAGWSYTHQVKNTPDAFISYYILDHLKNKAVGSGVHQLHEKAMLIWDISWYQRSGSYTGADMTEKTYPDVLLVNMGIQFHLNQQLKSEIKATNILNNKHFDFSGVMLPGRWVLVSLILNSDW